MVVRIEQEGSSEVLGSIQRSDWKKYDLASNPKREDYIIDHILVRDPDFGDLDALTGQIERGTKEFVKDVEEVLLKLDG